MSTLVAGYEMNRNPKTLNPKLVAGYVMNRNPNVGPAILEVCGTGSPRLIPLKHTRHIRAAALEMNWVYIEAGCPGQ